MSLRRTIAFFAMALTSMNPSVLAVDQSKNLPEFAQVDEGLYRGAQPTKEGYQELKKKGVKTVINFRHEFDQIESGRHHSTEAGMDYVSIPWTIYGKADPKVLDEFFSIANDPARQPVFFHCKRGAERTGVLAYSYYVQEERLSHDEAYEKAFGNFPLKWFWKPFVDAKIDEFRPHLKQEN